MSLILSHGTWGTLGPQLIRRIETMPQVLPEIQWRAKSVLSEGQFQELTADGAVDPIPGQEQAQEKSLEQLPLEAPGIPAPGPGSALRGSGSLSLGHTLHGSSLALGKGPWNGRQPSREHGRADVHRHMHVGHTGPSPPCTHRGRDVFAWVPMGERRDTNSVCVLRACACAHVRGVARRRGYMSVPACVYLRKWALRVEHTPAPCPSGHDYSVCVRV